MNDSLWENNDLRGIPAWLNTGAKRRGWNSIDETENALGFNSGELNDLLQDSELYWLINKVFSSSVLDFLGELRTSLVLEAREVETGEYCRLSVPKIEEEVSEAMDRINEIRTRYGHIPLGKPVANLLLVLFDGAAISVIENESAKIKKIFDGQVSYGFSRIKMPVNHVIAVSRR